MSLSLSSGRSSGWEDLSPWPGKNGSAACTITAVTDQTHFQIQTTTALPSGVTQPKIMVWNDSTSRWERLLVSSAALSSGTTYDIVLSSAPTKTLAVGDYISPYTQRLTILAETIEAYFDTLGPGELIDLTTDVRAHRAFRWPEPNEELPQRAGAGILAKLQGALGPALADSVLDSMSVSTPSLPTAVVDGPNLIVCGRVGIYPL